MPVDASPGKTTDLLKGIAAAAAQEGLGVYQTDPTKAYQPGDTAITFKNMPAAPDRCIILTAYGDVDDIAHPAGHINVQVRFRGNAGDALDVDDLADAFFDWFQGAVNQWFGQVHVTQAGRRSSVPMGMDAAKRWERADNYALDVEVPATANRSF